MINKVQTLNYIRIYQRCTKNKSINYVKISLKLVLLHIIKLTLKLLK